MKFSYQRAGARQKWKRGTYDPAVVPDIQAWLTSRLGPLASLQVEEAAPPAPRQHPRAADYDPALVARFACVAQGEPAPFRPAPVLPEIARFDPAAPIRFPPFARAILDQRPAPEPWPSRETGSGGRSHLRPVHSEHAA